MSKYWDPNDYSLENQISDIMGGRDVAVSDGGNVMKGNDSHVSIFWPSDSEKGHGHAEAKYDSNGKLIGIEVCHY